MTEWFESMEALAARFGVSPETIARARQDPATARIVVNRALEVVGLALNRIRELGGETDDLIALLTFQSPKEQR
jgi:hypothetical protein